MRNLTDHDVYCIKHEAVIVTENRWAQLWDWLRWDNQMKSKPEGWWQHKKSAVPSLNCFVELGRLSMAVSFFSWAAHQTSSQQSAVDMAMVAMVGRAYLELSISVVRYCNNHTGLVTCIISHTLLYRVLLQRYIGNTLSTYYKLLMIGQIKITT